MPGVADIRNSEARQVQIRREEDQMPQMPRPLLPSGYAREDTRSNAIQRPENAIISPIGGVALYYIEIDNWPSSKCYKDSYIIPKSFSHILHLHISGHPSDLP